MPKGRPPKEQRIIVTEIECDEPLNTENLQEDIFQFFFQDYLRRKGYEPR